MRKHLFSIIAVLVLLAGVYVVGHHSPSAAKPALANTHPKAAPVRTTLTYTPPSFQKTQYSTADSASIWVVVNKQHPLTPKTYVPADLVVPKVPLRVPGDATMQVRQVTATALEGMFAAAKTYNLNLMVASGYRSYTNQASLYNSYVAASGQAQADTFSARPGFSEHQTGFAVDIEPSSRKCEVDQCFGNTPEGQWLVANAYKYGFILRYTPAEQTVTGYESEPWHYRYVGIELSTQMHDQNIPNLEQFFAISGGPTYAQ